MKIPTLKTNPEETNILDAIIKDRLVRLSVTRDSHLLFFNIYFSHYVKYEIAEFQKDIFRITEDKSNKLACIVAFRGSGKSTLVTFSYSLWSILGNQQKKFVLIVCQTQAQAKQHMTNLRYELEHNKLLRSDLGPFQEETGGEWAMSSLVFSNTKARITIASIEQSIRGIRHYENRPDLIILDDVEDLNSTKTLEGRNKIFEWFTREIVPLGDIGTRIIIVGNLLHEDSLMMRLRVRIDDGSLDGIFKWYPLLDDKGKCLWPGKFDTQEKIDDLRRSVANELAWQQEYLLNIISDSTRVIFPEWIHYYDSIPRGDVYGIFVGVDLAISLKETADYTAIVSGVLTKENKSKDIKLYIFPNSINKRMTYPETIQTIKSLAGTLKYEVTPKIAIESNGFQQIFVDQLGSSGLNVEGIRNTTDKRSRLAMTSHYVQNGTILFPKQGAEDLITQLTGFGIEHHDDLSDAFALVVLQIVEPMESHRSLNNWLVLCDDWNRGSWRL